MVLVTAYMCPPLSHVPDSSFYLYCNILQYNCSRYASEEFTVQNHISKSTKCIVHPYNHKTPGIYMDLGKVSTDHTVVFKTSYWDFSPLLNYRCCCVVHYFLFLCVFFFFSSRRRHTRSLCDWSSDVCSSDLASPRSSSSFSRTLSITPNHPDLDELLGLAQPLGDEIGGGDGEEGAVARLGGHRFGDVGLPRIGRASCRERV